MFAKFPSLPEAEKSGSPADDGHSPASPSDIAGHGSRALDWHSLRAKLSAERDLRGSLRGENEAMASWIRAEGSFDPRAAEALCGHGHAPGDAASDGSDNSGGHDDNANMRLPDPKPSRHITGSGCSVPNGQPGSASGLNVED